MDVTDFMIIILAAVSIMIGFLLGSVITQGTIQEEYAEFVCETHDLQLIDFEREEFPFSKVECGGTAKQLDPNYKVFTK